MPVHPDDVRPWARPTAAPTRRGAARCWLVSFAVLFSTSSVWSLASPLTSGPDEPAHVVRAASVAAGQLVGDRAEELGGGNTYVEGPAALGVTGRIAACFAFHPELSAGCVQPVAGQRRHVRLSTSAGLAPPLYYALVGLPVERLPNNRGIYLARAVSALIFAVLVATALTAAWRWGPSPFLVTAIFVSVTPMTIFTTAVVNPSALEIGAVICVWVTGLLFVAPRDPARPPLGLLAAFTVSTCLFVLSRGLSPLRLAVIAATLLLASTRPRWRTLLGQRSVRVSAGVIVATSALAVAWIVVYKSLSSATPPLPSQPLRRDLAGAFGRTGIVVRSAVGMVGWLDTPPPFLVLVAWLSGAIFLLVLVGIHPSRRLRLAAWGITAASIIVPALLEASQVHRFGYVWQGRYSLPLMAGGLIVAGFALDTLDRSLVAVLARATRALLWVLAACLFVAYFFAFRRFAVGVNGPINFLDAPGWVSPLPPLVLVALALVSFLLLGAWAVHLTRQPAWASAAQPVDRGGTEKEEREMAAPDVRLRHAR